MSSIEWMTAGVLNGMLPIHEACARINAGKRPARVVAGFSESDDIARRIYTEDQKKRRALRNQEFRSRRAVLKALLEKNKK